MGYFIQGIKEKWEVVLGLEVHAQISASSKLFSSASTAYGAIPNSQVNLVDAGMPGALPVINKECVRQAIITGLGLNAKIQLRGLSFLGGSLKDLISLPSEWTLLADLLKIFFLCQINDPFCNIIS